jgi:GNAT superfamily N-acetyltransferase
VSLLVRDAWESELTGLSVYRVMDTALRPEHLAAGADLGASVLYLDCPGPLDPGDGRLTMVGELRSLALSLTAPASVAPHALDGWLAEAPEDIGRFDLGGRYRRDPRLAAFEDAAYARWVGSALDDPDRTVHLRPDGTVLLVLRWMPPTLTIELIGVDRAVRGRGLGREAMAAVQDAAVAAGMTRCTVGGYADNAAAMRLYEQSGYRSVESTWRYHVWLERS